MTFKKELQTWKIEEAKKEEIEETFRLCVPYLKKEKEELKEQKDYKVFLNVLNASPKSWIILELLVSLFSLFLGSFIVEDLKLWYLAFISILFASLLIIEWFRNLICNVWELESTCMFSSQKCLLYKILFMGITNFFFLFLLSLHTSLLSSHDFLIILCYSFFPFLSTIAITLEFITIFKNKTTLMAGFVGGNICTYLFSSYFSIYPMKFVMLILTILTFFLTLLSSYHYFQKMEKERGSLLWN